MPCLAAHYCAHLGLTVMLIAGAYLPVKAFRPSTAHAALPAVVGLAEHGMQQVQPCLCIAAARMHTPSQTTHKTWMCVAQVLQAYAGLLKEEGVDGSDLDSESDSESESASDSECERRRGVLPQHTASTCRQSRQGGLTSPAACRPRTRGCAFDPHAAACREHHAWRA